MKISSPGKDKLMERKFSLEKRSEKTTRSTGKTGLPPWYQQYRFQEEPTDNKRPLHGDPRDKHDNDFTSSDDDSDHGYGHPGVGIGPVPDFSARASSAGELGTLAGTGEYDRAKSDRFWIEYDEVHTHKKAYDNENYYERCKGYITEDQYNTNKQRLNQQFTQKVNSLLNKHFDAGISSGWDGVNPNTLKRQG
jgi:hypothetical protein